MEYVGKLITLLAIQKVSDIIKTKFLDIIIKNVIWNIIFLAIIIAKINIYSVNLILLYYLVVYGILVYGLSKLIIKITEYSTLLPNISRKFRLYLYFLIIIFVIDFINTIYELKFDIPIYLTLILVTIYIIRIDQIKAIYKVCDLLITAEPKLKFYIVFYVGSNILTSLICMFIYNKN